MKLIVNADDFGISLGTNYGILEAHKNGVVTSTTLMVNMPAASHAVDLAKATPTLGLGIHFNLTKGKPLTKASGLVEDSGEFFKSYENVAKINEDVIETELRAQLEKFLSYGIEPTHFDSHHHVHLLPNVLNVVEKLAREYKKPVRKAWYQDLCKREISRDIRGNDVFGDFFGNGVTVDTLISIIKESKGEVLEVMCHPSFIDPEIYKGSSYNLGRINEYEILTSEKLKSFIKESNIELIHYGKI